MRTTAFVLSFLLSALPLAAQYPGDANSFVWSGTTMQAGPQCWGFNCTPYPATCVAGEAVTLGVWGGWYVPYAIGFSSSATSCVGFPGFWHGLILDPPITIVWTGTLSQLHGILSCPPCYDLITTVVPVFFPSGTTFALQAVTGTGGGTYSFSAAVHVTVL